MIVGTEVTDLVVSAVGLSVAVIATAVAALAKRSSDSVGDDIREWVGTPNGHGNVVAMLERVLAGQTGQDARLARLEAWQAEVRDGLRRHGERIGAVEQDVAALTARMDEVCRDGCDVDGAVVGSVGGGVGGAHGRW